MNMLVHLCKFYFICKKVPHHNFTTIEFHLSMNKFLFTFVKANQLVLCVTLEVEG